MLPAPTDRTIRFGSAPVCTTSGAMMPAVVSPATVADPMDNRIATAIPQPRIMGETLMPFNNIAR